MIAMNDVLLTVSGVIDPNINTKIADGERPEADYIAMARTFSADLLDYAGARKATNAFGNFLDKTLGSNALLAWESFRRRKQYRVIFTDGEQVGIPLAFFLKFFSRKRDARHLMISHVISVWKKSLLLDVFRLYSHIDFFFVYSTWQKRFIEERWKVAPEKVVFTPFMVDAHFFDPKQVEEDSEMAQEENARPMICAVGLEFRDYPTLIEAVRDLDVQVIIAAASPWSKRSDTTSGQVIPEHVLVQRFSQYELREVYQACRFMVMPLYDVEFQAGVTAILEAMAMQKAVVCSKTPGQTDVVVEGETGLYAAPGDVKALKEAITYLLEKPEESRRMGKNGRQRVLASMSLDCYVDRLKGYVQKAKE
jgi:glycosyltransferase involved in cell wall biosynthesis